MTSKRMKYILPAFVSLCIASYIVQGQVTMFQPKVISNDEEFGITIAPDGDEVLFMRAYGGRDSVHIFQSSKVNGEWVKPRLSFFSDKSTIQIDPFYSPDGKSILYNEQTSDSSGYDIYIINRSEKDWSAPKLLSESINTKAHEFFATMSLNRNIYFTRRNESNDIYVSFWDNGQYQTAVPIQGAVNTLKDSESNPFISPNEDYLIFSSRRPGGFGNADLYISFINDNGNWSHPINLGDTVNTSDSEFCPGLFIKKKKFVFSRTKFEGDLRIENIFTVPFKSLKITKLKKLAKW